MQSLSQRSLNVSRQQPRTFQKISSKLLEILQAQTFNKLTSTPPLPLNLKKFHFSENGSQYAECSAFYVVLVTKLLLNV